jgi:hypothetical protein
MDSRDLRISSEDEHPNARAHEIAAASIAEFVCRLNWFACGESASAATPTD